MNAAYVQERMGFPWWVAFGLAQGIVAPILFAGIVFVGGHAHPDYSHFSQAISELTAADAVNKRYLDIALLAMELLTITFGIAYASVVCQTNWYLKSSAAFLVFIGVVGCFFYGFPMDPIGSEMTRDGQTHLVLVTLSALAAMSAVLLAAMGWSRMARRSSIAVVAWVSLIVMASCGLASAVVGVWGLPGIGAWQRLSTSAFLLWQLATAITLLRGGRILSADH